MTTISTARVATASASRYLQQLSKHWSHKFAVEFDASHARIPLPIGVATMAADAEALDVRLEAENAEALPRLKQVVADHLDRFTWADLAKGMAGTAVLVLCVGLVMFRAF